MKAGAFSFLGIALWFACMYNGHMQESRPEGRALEINTGAARLILNEISSHLVPTIPTVQLSSFLPLYFYIGSIYFPYTSCNGPRRFRWRYSMPLYWSWGTGGL